jgi:hypothetical protein
MIEFSEKIHIEISPTLSRKVQWQIEDGIASKRLSEDARPSAFKTLISLKTYETFGIGPSAVFSLGKTGSAQAAAEELRNSTGQQVLRVQGEDTALYFGEGGSFGVGMRPIAFEGLNFIGSSKYSTPLSVNGDATTTLVKNGKLENVTQPLDRIVWINVNFENSNILYTGGPVFLQNVRFTDCEFQFRQDANSIELYNQILKAAGAPITYVIWSEKKPPR